MPASVAVSSMADERHDERHDERARERHKVGLSDGGHDGARLATIEPLQCLGSGLLDHG